MATAVKLRGANKLLKQASNYEEWVEGAIAHDQGSGMDDWRETEKTRLYDYKEIKLRLETLRDFRAKGDDEGLLFTLNEGIHGNMGGMGSPKLYNKAKFGTKSLIVEYVDEISNALAHLADPKNTSINFEDKLDFFRRASRCFGCSALMLSGGGQLGNFHLGVLIALSKRDLLPGVISGSSAGSLFAAIVGTRTNAEVADYFHDESYFEMLQQGATIFESIDKNERVNISQLEQIVETLIPDMTFQEAHAHSGRNINISIAPKESQQKSRLLNAVASPNVKVRSAVMASCAIPGIFPPVTLMAKNRNGDTQPYLPSRQWVDGSMSNDLPSKRLARLYGVNHFIVSLTNPIVLPFISDPASQNEFLAPVRKLGSSILKETTQFNYTMAKRFFKYVPAPITFAANTINSVVQQDYVGDINIIADWKAIGPRKVLSALTMEEMKELIQMGERRTWPKLEAIRVTTKVGRILDRILNLYEATNVQMNAMDR